MRCNAAHLVDVVAFVVENYVTEINERICISAAN